MTKRGVPRILLIGAGVFGVNYIKILRKLEGKKLLEIKGIVVKSKKSAWRISKEYNIQVFRMLNGDLLDNVDAVFIVTPPESHYDLVKNCIKHTNIFVEKPIAKNYNSAKELETYAKKYSKVLMVGHVYRFHPVIKKLKKMFKEDKNKPNFVRGEYTNPINTDNNRNISLEMLHLYDILDYLFNKSPIISTGMIKDRTNIISLRYPNGLDAVLEIGWKGDNKLRKLSFNFRDKKRILCDLGSNIIEIYNIKKSKERLTDKVCEKLEEMLVKKIECKQKLEPLEEEILTFLNILKKKKIDYPNGEIGTKIVKIATSINFLPKEKPKVAIIGAGIFGVNCAIQLGRICDVTILERNNDIMREASFINQYRHHEGFHYPRSQETVDDIKKASKSFEFFYNKAIIRNFPTYYSVAKYGSRVSAEEYLKFCYDNRFSFTLEHPPEEYLNREKVSISLKTLEPIYNYNIFYRLAKSYLLKNNNIKIKLNSEVIHGKIDNDGKKIVTIRDGKEEYKEKYDIIINVTYANLNKFAIWFNFPIKLLRIDLVEALIVRVPIPKISFAIMDGPFTNLVPTSEDNLFTLVHIKHSMLRRGVPKNGLIPKSWMKIKSNQEMIIEKSKEFLPILNKAEVAEKRYVFRGVNAYREHDDARPSDIIYYGFGCWSILGGKIINCVDTALELLDEVKQN